MKMSLSPLFLMPALLLAGLPSVVFAADDPPAKINLAELGIDQAVMIDEVMIPVPQEIFNSLDKLGKHDWSKEFLDANFSKFGHRSQIALLFGVVVAEGFLGVQAKDSERVKDTGQRVLKLSTALGVKSSVARHCQSIIEASHDDDWETVRTELDRAHESVRQAMKEMRDEHLAHLVSVGGWVRGTEVLCSVLEKNYTADAAELLNQKEMIQHLIKHSGTPTKDARVLESVIAGLSELKKTVGDDPSKPVSASSVKSARVITQKIVSQIVANQPST